MEQPSTASTYSVTNSSGLSSFFSEVFTKEQPNTVDARAPQELPESTTVLDREFFRKSCHVLANELLGKLLVRQLSDGTVIKGRIVETEAYPGETDRASHTFRGKTNRNEAMFMEAGTAYVYIIYGMYDCFNISSQESGAGVLIRALEPVDGLEAIRGFRKNGAAVKDTQLCNGPGRLCQALNVTTAGFNRHNLTLQRDLWLESAPDYGEFSVVSASRIGVASYGAEWAMKPWRYYILGSPHVSKRDKIAEAASVLSSVPESMPILHKKQRKRKAVST